MSYTFNTIQDFRCPPKEQNMKLLISLLLLGAAKLSASDDLKFLDAISQVESGGRDDAVGPCGSRGRFQIKESTWKALTHWPHGHAHRPLKSQIIAMKLLKALKEELGMKPGEEDYLRLAYAWLAGGQYGKKQETNKQLLDRIGYGVRVMTILKELK